MAKKKTDNKELKSVKIEKEVKKPVEKKVEIPNQKWIKILLYKDNKVHKVGYETAKLLIEIKKAELA